MTSARSNASITSSSMSGTPGRRLPITRALWGFPLEQYRGLETGDRDAASYVLEQGKVRLVLTAALSPDHHVARFVFRARRRRRRHRARGPRARPRRTKPPPAAARSVSASQPEDRDAHGVFRHSAIRGYGDTVIKFVERGDYSGAFAPGFEPCPPIQTVPAGLAAIDHIVGNVELGGMDRWVRVLRGDDGVYAAGALRRQEDHHRVFRADVEGDAGRHRPHQVSDQRARRRPA